MSHNEINSACFYAEAKIGEGKHRGFALIVTKHGIGTLCGPLSYSKPSISNRIFAEFSEDYKLPPVSKSSPMPLDAIHKTAQYKKLKLTVLKKFESRLAFVGHNLDKFISEYPEVFKPLEDDQISKAVLLKLKGHFEQYDIISKAIKLEQIRTAEALKQYETQPDWGIF